jgi:hypothetical protein
MVTNSAAAQAAKVSLFITSLLMKAGRSQHRNIVVFLAAARIYERIATPLRL